MGAWGQGLLRERRPGVFEIRITVGADPVSGRTVQRLFWFRGETDDAEERRSELAAQIAEYRAVRRATPFLTVGELLERWKEVGISVSVVSGRFRVLRSSVGWAQSESIIDRNPIRDMRGSPRPGTRMHMPVGDVATLIKASEKLVEKAEQVQLLVRLAADSSARMGELAALRFGDLDGRVLTIERGVSGEEVGPTKTRQVRRLTLGRTTVELWRVSEAAWRRRAAGKNEFGEWLFSRDLDHGRRLPAVVLAELLHIHPTTAVHWVAGGGGDWSTYAAQVARDR